MKTTDMYKPFISYLLEAKIPVDKIKALITPLKKMQKMRTKGVMDKYAVMLQKRLQKHKSDLETLTKNAKPEVVKAYKARMKKELNQIRIQKNSELFNLKKEFRNRIANLKKSL